jgi:large subunit ribosomal protein L4
MPQVAVLDPRGKTAGTLELKPEVFAVEVRGPLLHQAVTRELAARRAGTHDTKERSEVSGGGRKPWRQKGTGRARQGSIRAPQWRKGGTVFGPTPRGYAQRMTRQGRREALRAALTDTVNAEELRVVERLELPEGKTGVLAQRLADLGLRPVPTLLVVEEVGEALERAARNIPWLTLGTPSHVSAYQLLRHPQVLFERGALLSLQEALAR